MKMELIHSWTLAGGTLSAWTTETKSPCFTFQTETGETRTVAEVLFSNQEKMSSDQLRRFFPLTFASLKTLSDGSLKAYLLVRGPGGVLSNVRELSEEQRAAAIRLSLGNLSVSTEVIEKHILRRTSPHGFSCVSVETVNNFKFPIVDQIVTVRQITLETSTGQMVANGIYAFCIGFCDFFSGSDSFHTVAGTGLLDEVLGVSNPNPSSSQLRNASIQNRKVVISVGADYKHIAVDPGEPGKPVLIYKLSRTLTEAGWNWTMEQVGALFR